MRYAWLVGLLLLACSRVSPAEEMLPAGSSVVLRSGAEIVCDRGIWTSTAVLSSHMVRCYLRDGYMDLNRVDFLAVKVKTAGP